MLKSITILLCLCGSCAFAQSAADRQYQDAQRQYNQQLSNQQRETALNQMQNKAGEENLSRKTLEHQIELSFKEKRKLISQISALNSQKSDLLSRLENHTFQKEHKEIQKNIQQIELKLARLNRKILQNDAEFKVLHKKYTETARE